MNRPDDRLLVQRSIEFALWMAMQPQGGASVERVMCSFECSRATAYRWIRAYKDAVQITAARRFTTVESRLD